MAEESDRSYGKVPRYFFEKIIYPKLGSPRPEVLVGPSSGVDTSVIRLSQNQVLIATTDPISLIPELGPSDSAWMSVNLLANDLATSSFKPQYLMLDFNLPPTMSHGVFEEYWNSLSEECSQLGIAIVGGHTGKFDGIDSTVIGSGVMFSTGSAHYLTASGAKVGDSVILTKGAAVSSTGILAKVFADKIRDKIGQSGLENALSYFRKISAVEDALTAARAGVGIGAVTAMHDVTEGGVVSALCELANASSLGLVIDRAKIFVSAETREICSIFGIDPYVSLGEGALVISCHPSKSQEVIESLEHNGTSASIVGELLPVTSGIKFIESGQEVPYTYPVVDPYWKAY
ncbi:MAG: AIR synthase family protein, partial [Nitrososphaerales archaeon]